MKFFFLLFFSGLVSSDPQVYWLNKFNNGNTPTGLQVETGGNLYLASNDDTAQLQKIKITNGANTFQLDQLQNGSGIRILSDWLTIQVNIDNAAELSGFLYATTAQQANDNTFYVTVVNGAQTLSRTDVVNSTTVVLNTEYKNNFPPFDAPAKTTAVKEIQQFGTTELNFHHEIPGANYRNYVLNNFFENPLYYFDYDENGNQFTRRVFFGSVEPMQVNLPYWYITATGPYSMKLSNTFDSSTTHNTTSTNATGVFVLTDVWLNHTVNFVTDNTRGGVCGNLVTTDLKYTVDITFHRDESTFAQQYGARKVVHSTVSSNMAAKSLDISATAIYPGTLFLQYFVFTGDLLPTTAPTTIRTTTPASPTDTCQDTLNPNTGVNDCPGLKNYCSVPSYVTMMKERCPLTCGYCVCTGTTSPPVASLCPAGMTLVNNSCCPNADVHKAAACSDRINPQTGVDDCPGMIAYCNNPIYHDIMQAQCSKTCGFC